MKKPVRILSTKKLLPNQRQFLLNADFAVLESDFIAIRSKAFVMESCNENFIFTSQNAVRRFLENEIHNQFKGRKVFCVGLKTKALLEEKGFHVIASADNAAQLADKIKLYKNETFTFFCGNIKMETLPMSLKIAGVKFNEIEVYETILAPNKVTTRVDAILFFSPSAVESYLQQHTIDNETCFCIGKTTAEPLLTAAKDLVIANHPTIENVIAQCINYYKQ